MRHLTYLAVLVFILLASGWLELVLHVRVLARWKRLLATVLPVAAVFAAWDLYAVAQGHWWFDLDWFVGVVLPGGLPLEEALFFLVVPLAAILALEAVRTVRGWPVGDEQDR